VSGRHAALAIVLAVVATEAGLRLARFGWTPAALGPWRAAPPWERLRTFDPAGDPLPVSAGAAAWALAPGMPVVRYRLNTLGLREEREVTPHPAPGVCRLLALGDAYTFGYGVRVERAYPQVLERRLARAGQTRFEVLNAGFPNLHVEQQRRRLARLLPRLSPHVVLLSFDWWNVMPPAPGARPTRWSAEWVAANVEQKAERLGAQVGLADGMLRQARGMLTPALFPPSGLARELEPLSLPPETVAERWTATRSALAGMARDVAAVGARLVLVRTPLDLEVDPSRNALYRAGQLPYPAHGFVDLDYRSRRALPEALRRFAREAGITLLDLGPAFARHDTALFFVTDYHMAPAGHRRIAREVAHWVRRARPCAGLP
jgi:hypothetical protein